MKPKVVQALEAQLQAWKESGDLSSAVVAALNETDHHPALALWALQNETVAASTHVHRKIAEWTQTLRRLMDADAWSRERSRLLERLPVPLRMWVLVRWTEHWDFSMWEEAFNDPRLFQWVYHWAQRDPYWVQWLNERVSQIRSDRLRKKVAALTAVSPASPVITAPELNATVFYLMPASDAYYWFLPYTLPDIPDRVILILKTQADRRVLDGMVARLDAADADRLLRSPSETGPMALLPLWIQNRYPDFFQEETLPFALRVPQVNSLPFLIEAFERTPRDAWPFQVRAYAHLLVDPWFQRDRTDTLRAFWEELQVADLQPFPTTVPFNNDFEVYNFLVHLYALVWAYHSREDALRFVHWIEDTTAGLTRPPFLSDFLHTFRSPVFAPALPPLNPELRRAFGKAYLLVRGEALDEQSRSSAVAIARWTGRDLMGWLRGLCQASAG